MKCFYFEVQILHLMKKIYFLKSCSTCARIIKDLDLPSEYEFQDIKEKGMTAKQLEALHNLSGSYEALFSKRAQFYKDMGLKDKNLSEKDYKNYLLEHYTFLSRPVIVFDGQIFIGNSAKTLEAAKKAIHG